MRHRTYCFVLSLSGSLIFMLGICGIVQNFKDINSFVQNNSTSYTADLPSIAAPPATTLHHNFISRTTWIGYEELSDKKQSSFTWENQQTGQILLADNYAALIDTMSHPWPVNYADNYSWCTKYKGRYTVDGLIFVKNIKAASSTGAGITIQIAHHVGRRVFGSYMNIASPCSHRFRHGSAFRSRTPPYFLWTNVRNPTKVFLSTFFHFEVARESKIPNLFNLKRFAETIIPNQQLSYIMTSKAKHWEPQDWLRKYNNTRYLSEHFSKYQNDSTAQIWHFTLSKIQNLILNEYNFIAIVERMDESLVVLKLLLGLEMRDIIVLSSKQSGGYDDGKSNNQTCVFVPKSYTTAEMQKYLQSSFRENNFDFVLYDILNACLDKTIDLLGRELVEEQVVQFQKYQEYAKNACMARAVFPCSATGEYQAHKANCYFNDAGCGHSCVQDLLQTTSIKL